MVSSVRAREDFAAAEDFVAEDFADAEDFAAEDFADAEDFAAEDFADAKDFAGADDFGDLAGFACFTGCTFWSFRFLKGPFVLQELRCFLSSCLDFTLFCITGTHLLA